MSPDTKSVCPEHAILGGTLQIPRLINGLWQLAGGHDKEIDLATAAQGMKPLISAGFNCFDMADHYGEAELVIGRHNASAGSKILAFTKWCPVETEDKSFAKAEAAVNLALERMGSEKIALLQYHIWDYTNDAYLHDLDHIRTLQSQGKIDHIGLTNVDAAHLELLLDSGFNIATNQVSCSLLDRRVVQGRLAKVCSEHGVGILAYGTLLGGFISEKWLGRAEPSSDDETLNWSLRKYLRFIKAAGGWDTFQTVLRAVGQVAVKHAVSIAAVATRHVLDVPVVSAVIVGTRLRADECSKYAASNLGAFSFQLDADDKALIAKAQEGMQDIAGDCGDEYRRPPFLTAAGDLSHHLKENRDVSEVAKAIEKGARIEYASGSKWEPIAGYCRAVRTGNVIRVSGTTAHAPIASIAALGGPSARSQTVAILDIISRALKALGSTLSDVVRTRIVIRHEADCEAVSLAHGWVFQCVGVRPANTLVTGGLIGDDFLVEIEAEAEVGCGSGVVMRFK